MTFLKHMAAMTRRRRSAELQARSDERLSEALKQLSHGWAELGVHQLANCGCEDLPACQRCVACAFSRPE